MTTPKAAPLNNQSSALIDLLKDELTNITLERLMLIESNVNKLIAERKEALKTDALAAIKQMVKDLNLNAEDCADILPIAKAPVVVVETKPKRKMLDQPKFSFTYEVDGTLVTKTEKATGNKSKAFNEAVASNPDGLLGIVDKRDYDRLKAFLDVQKKK